MLDDFLVPVDGIDTDTLLADWRWLIGDEPYSLRAIAAVGNLFLEDRSGRVFLLSIEDGQLDEIAPSAEQFEAMLGDRHNRKEWLSTSLVRELRRSGVPLGPGQCYGYKTPLVLLGDPGEGDLLDDVEPIDLVAHVSMLGQIHRQVKELPPGTVIDDIHVTPPPES